jgi:nitric oxide dioxygenase
MAVDVAQIRLVRESLPSIREHRVPVSMNFYNNLFALAPELRALFRSDIAGQGMRFMTTLATIADLLDAPDELSDEIDDLAKAHAGLGVKAADFAPMARRSWRRWPKPSARSSLPSLRRHGTPPTIISPR